MVDFPTFGYPTSPTEDGDEDPIERLKNTFEPEDLKVFPVSAASNQGLKELLYHVWQILSTMDPEPTVYEKEYVPEYDLGSNLPYTVEKTDEHLFTVEGPRMMPIHSEWCEYLQLDRGLQWRLHPLHE